MYFADTTRVHTMWCFEDILKPRVVDPIFDLEKVIFDLAWPRFIEAELQDGCCGCYSESWAKKNFVMDVDWAHIKRKDIIIDHKEACEVSRNGPDVTSPNDIGMDLDEGKVYTPDGMCVFETNFENTSDVKEPQTFQFNFNKEITTTSEMNVKEGFTIAGSLELSPSLAVLGDATASISPQWTGEKGQVLQDSNKMAWTLNSEIKLASGEKARVAAYVRETSHERHVTIESRFDLTSFNGRIAVNVRRREDNKLYAIQELSCKVLNDHEDCRGRINRTANGFSVTSEADVNITSVTQDVKVTRPSMS